MKSIHPWFTGKKSNSTRLSDHDRRVIRHCLGGRPLPDRITIERGVAILPSNRLSPEELEERIRFHRERVEREEPAADKALCGKGGADKAARLVNNLMVAFIVATGTVTSAEVAAAVPAAGGEAKVHRRLKQIHQCRVRPPIRPVYAKHPLHGIELVSRKIVAWEAC